MMIMELVLAAAKSKLLPNKGKVKNTILVSLNQTVPIGTE